MKRAFLLVHFVIAGMMVLLPSSTVAQLITNTWAANQYGYWTNSSNWSLNSVPDSGSAIIFNSGGIYLSSDEQIGGVDWNGSSYSAFGDANNGGLHTLTVNDFFNINGTAGSQFSLNLNQLTIQNGAQMTWSASGNGNTTVNGTAGIQNYGTFTASVAAGSTLTGNGNGSGPTTEPGLGTIYNNVGSTFNKTGGGTLTFNGSGGAGLVNAGTVNLSGGSITANVNFTNSGTVIQHGGTTNLFNSSGLYLTETSGRYDVQHNALLRGNVIIKGGRLMGNGTVSPYGDLIVTGTGIIDAGDEIGQAGQLTLTTALNLNGGGTLHVDIAGTTPMLDYDQVIAANFSKLTGGNLDISLNNGFMPSAEDIFNIFYDSDGSAVQGTFNGLANGATVFVNGGQFTIEYGATNVFLMDFISTVPTPEPPPLALFATAAVSGWALLKFKRRC